MTSRSRSRPHDGPTLDELVKGLQRIPPTQREVLVMRELEGRSYREIQQILELTPTALEMLLFRARRSLAEELENVVTCELAERAMSKRLDGRLSRKERRRLLEHLAECPSCARLDAGQKKRRRAFGALAVLPLPLSLTFFKGAPSASAATGLPTIGTGELTVAGGGSTGTGGGILASGVGVQGRGARGRGSGGRRRRLRGRRTGRRPRAGDAARHTLRGDGRAGRRAAAPGPGGSHDAGRGAPQGARGRGEAESDDPRRGPRRPRAAATTPTAAGAGAVQTQPSLAQRADAHATAVGTGDAVADAVTTPENTGEAARTR